MNNFLIKNKTQIKIVILLLSFSLLYMFKGIGSSLNQQVENVLYAVGGAKQPDTNIVIIHITEEDIQNFGAWPLKRNYYALLISQLTSLNVKKIGLEIFLSEKLTSQSVYNELLNSEIQKSGKVILSSVVNDFNAETRNAKIIFPEPKLLFPGFNSGHLSFIENGGVVIPLRIKDGKAIEPSFSFALSGMNKKYNDISKIKINFISSWLNFKNFSLLQFFRMVENNDTALKSLQGKIVIIGVSDPLIARMITTNFDEKLPGVALHAFAIDNLLNNRYIKTNYNSISAFLIILLLSAFVLIGIKLKLLYKYFALLLLFLLFSFILFNFFFVEIYYALFVIPFFLLAVVDLLAFVVERKSYLVGILNETALLKKAMELKESQLIRLQNEMKVSGENASQEMKEKIAGLQTEIDDLKIRQSDELPVPALDETLEANNFYGLIYKSKLISAAVETIKKVAPENATVLILGESGTGKELIARAIHTLSKRSSGNFVAVNCAALSDTLLESELFGHVKGAFTNAVADKMGRFEAADKGTIFLDEIGETSENFQVKLLRILQSGEFEKVGSSKTGKTDVRVIAATNKNLEQLIKGKKFREDLYYRLNVIKIQLPALRERKDDIQIIANHFLSGEPEKFVLSKAVLEQLISYEWKGNVRELESVIKRAIIFARSAGRKIIKLNDLPPEMVPKEKLNLEEIILDSLREKNFSHSSINETAKEIEISRTIVSENFRGLVLRTYCDSNFDVGNTIKKIALTDEEQVNEKVKSKILTFLNNIEKDVNQNKSSSFEETKSKLISKYQNLPQKFHIYLDEIIKKCLNR
ncbi:MAG: sigma 54-interacting transcriptional regulator [Ignavibacteriales bacterium]|nr:sigma 54-interacting transcriptional regulator [Ignavibacteriales bacterium]